MANEYVDLTLLKAALKITDSDRDSLLQLALEAASRQVDNTTGRRFYLDITATARIIGTTRNTMRERRGERLLVPDIGDLTGLVVEVGEDPTWTDITSSIRTEPVTAPEDDRPVTSLLFRRGRFLNSLEAQVTAQWGWPAVPTEVEQAALIQAMRLFKRKDSPEGVLGSAEWGTVRVARLDPDVAALVSSLMLPGFG